MKRKALATTVLIAVLAGTTFFAVQASGKDDITKVREATAGLQHTATARAAGYDLMPGLDYCFQSYGAGGLGYHFINTKLLDTTVDLLHPEALIYSPDSNGSIQLGAVAYMVPTGAWDADHITPPQLMGQNFHIHEKLGMYILHAWIWMNNPSGSFEDWNPDVFCPAPIPVPWDGPVRWR